MNINKNFTENDIDKIDIQTLLEHQIQIEETKEPGETKINSMKIRINKTGELNGSSFVKLHLRSKALINIENDDKYCFVWSILASLHPCETDHPNRVSNYKQNFNDLIIQGFDFTNGFRCSDVHRFNEIK